MRYGGGTNEELRRVKGNERKNGIRYGINLPSGRLKFITASCTGGYGKHTNIEPLTGVQRLF
jgi:hypothetical protein